MLLYQDVTSGTNAAIFYQIRQHTDGVVKTWKEPGSLMTWLRLPHFRTCSNGCYILSSKLVWGLWCEAFTFCQKYLKVQYYSFYNSLKFFFYLNFSISSVVICFFKPMLPNNIAISHVAIEHLKRGYFELRLCYEVQNIHQIMKT